MKIIFSKTKNSIPPFFFKHPISTLIQVFSWTLFLKINTSAIYFSKPDRFSRSPSVSSPTTCLLFPLTSLLLPYCTAHSALNSRCSLPPRLAFSLCFKCSPLPLVCLGNTFQIMFQGTSRGHLLLYPVIPPLPIPNAWRVHYFFLCPSLLVTYRIPDHAVSQFLAYTAASLFISYLRCRISHLSLSPQ